MKPATDGGWRTLVRCGRRKKKAGRFRGRRLHKEKTYSKKYGKGTRGPSGPTKGGDSPGRSGSVQ
jgi:hypothetical protein